MAFIEISCHQRFLVKSDIKIIFKKAIGGKRLGIFLSENVIQKAKLKDKVLFFYDDQIPGHYLLKKDVGKNGYKLSKTKSGNYPYRVQITAHILEMPPGTGFEPREADYEITKDGLLIKAV